MSHFLLVARRMSELREVGDIQLNEDMAFQRREWRAQRIGWIAMLLVLALAMLGVFGRGPVSSAESGSRSTFGVTYDRIIRHGAVTELEFSFGEGLQRDSTLKLYIAHDYLRSFTIHSITPEPAGTGLSGRFVYYEFTRPNARRASQVVFHLQPINYWRQRALIGLQGATAIRYSQFVLP